VWVYIGREFAEEGGTVMDVGMNLSGRTSVWFQATARELAVIRLTRRRAVYTDGIYELVLTNRWSSIRQVRAFKLC